MLLKLPELVLQGTFTSEKERLGRVHEQQRSTAASNFPVQRALVEQRYWCPCKISSGQPLAACSITRLLAAFAQGCDGKTKLHTVKCDTSGGKFSLPQSSSKVLGVILCIFTIFVLCSHLAFFDMQAL